MFWTKAFWLDTLERAIKTGLQAVILAWGVDLTNTANAFELDFSLAGGVFLGGVLISLIFSAISAPVTNRGTASVVSEIIYK